MTSRLRSKPWDSAWSRRVRALYPEVTVEWLLHEERRWDTRGVLRSPDVDNIVKPVVDGFCGPRGVLIDDCRVQSIHCH